MIRRPLLSAVLAAILLWTIPGKALAGPETWVVDPDHTTIEFKVRHMMVSWVKGNFPKVDGTVVFDPTDVKTMSVDVSIPTSAIDTRVQKRDDHLRSPDFFDVQKFPTMTFKSKRVQNVKPEGFELVGDLTIHGVTKEVVLSVDGPSAEVKSPDGAFRRGASATGKINRKDFGLVWNKAIETGGVAVGDDVQISIEVEAKKKI